MISGGTDRRAEQRCGEYAAKKRKEHGNDGTAEPAMPTALACARSAVSLPVRTPLPAAALFPDSVARSFVRTIRAGCQARRIALESLCPSGQRSLKPCRNPTYRPSFPVPPVTVTSRSSNRACPPVASMKSGAWYARAASRSRSGPCRKVRPCACGTASSAKAPRTSTSPIF